MRVTHETIKQQMRLGVPLFTPCEEMQEKKRCLTTACGFSFTDAAYMLCYASRIAEDIKEARKKYGIK